MAADPDLPYKGLLRHYQPSKPLIAAVEGVAIAGGTELLQGTDIRVAGESARFGVSEARWSLYPMAGSAVRLRRQIPYTHAAEILLTAKHLPAAEATRIGLIGHVVPDGQALTKAKEIAEQINNNGPLAVEAILRTLRETDGDDRGRGARARVRVRAGRVRERRRQGRAEGVRREAHAQLPAEVAAVAAPSRLRHSAAIYAVR